MTSSEGTRLGEEAARRLARTGQHEIGPGLTATEFARIERDYGFEFADDHRAFLAVGLPLNPPWPDWRDGGPGHLREQLGWPVEGALFDVEHNALWHPSWGQRPGDIGHALGIAREHLSRAPAMIPVYGHRCLPAGEGTYGHPVMSIYRPTSSSTAPTWPTTSTASSPTPAAASARTGPGRPWCRSGASSSNAVNTRSTADITAVLRSWEDRFGARLLKVDFWWD